MINDSTTRRSRQPRGWKRMFLDNEGNPSSMRVMSAVAFVTSAYLAIIEVFYKKASGGGVGSSDTELVFYFLVAAFMPKALQKFAEGDGETTAAGVFDNRKRWLTDRNGNPSSMRLMSLGSLLVAMALAVIEVQDWGSGEGKNELVLYFLAAAFVPKAIQKFAESARQ